MLLVKYPTRHRWPKFFHNIRQFVELSSAPSSTFYMVSFDDDDPVPADILNYPWPVQVLFVPGPAKGKVAAINRGVSIDADWTGLVVIADDMVPSAGWDETIRNDLSKLPGGFGAINYNVDPRLGEGWKSLVVLPVMTRQLYDYFGYVYHPDYVSEHCDNEQTEVLEQMQVLTHIDKRPITHEWFANVDALSLANIEAGKIDRSTYERRKASGFKA